MRTMQLVDEDLGALLARAARRLVAAERPLLDAQGLTMWEYVVLTHLRRGEAPTQQALATAVGYDKTRLIALLDGLQERGLIGREPGAHDRRTRVVRLTDAGREAHGAAQRVIRAMEEDALADLDAAERRSLRALLARVAG